METRVLISGPVRVQAGLYYYVSQTSTVEGVMAAGEKGIPQVLSTGGLDFLIFGQLETVMDRPSGAGVFHFKSESET